MAHVGSEQSSGQRKSQAVSCQECRRLKLKCDRVFPCASCIRRGCANLCPHGTLEKGKRGFLRRLEQSLPSASSKNSAKDGEASEVAMFVARDAAMSKRIQELEAALTNAGVPIPGAPMASSKALNPSNKRPRSSSTSESNADFSTLSPDPTKTPGDPSDVTLGFGTLTIDVENKTRYIGLSGASAYLNENLWKTGQSRMPSRRNSHEDLFLSDKEPVPNQDGHVFSPPLSGVELPPPMDDAAFPPYAEAHRLAGLYFENASWMYEVVPREIFFTAHLTLVYPTSASPTQKPIPHDILALVAIVLALGAFFDLDLSFPAAKLRAAQLHSLSVAWLSAHIPQDGALKLETIPAVQTVHLMVLYQLSTRGRGDGEAAWQLLGMAMRAIQAQGCHRDGSRWNLPERDLEERRRVFWETHTYDRLQSFTFGRPYSQSDTHHDGEMPKSCDTPLPSDNSPANTEFSHTRWHHHKFRFALLLGRIIDEAFAAKHPTYSVIMQLDREINDFYVELPKWMLCESVTDPIKDLQPGSGTGQRAFLRKDAQIFSLANMIFLTKLHLHRGPFCRALMHAGEALKSRYESSVIRLTEAARAIINISRGLFTLHPTLTCRMWYFLFHSFTAAVCLSVLVIVAPFHPLAPLAYDSMQMALDLFVLAEGDMAEIARERIGRLAGKAKDVLESWRQANGRENDVGRNGRFPESNIRGNPEDLLGASTTLIRIQPTEGTPVDPEAVVDGQGAGDMCMFFSPLQPADLLQVPYASGISRVPFPSSMDPTRGWSDESFMNYLNNAQTTGNDLVLTQVQWTMNTSANINLNVDGFDLSSFIQNGATAWMDSDLNAPGSPT
ncbi:fungal-specific transcription factor domain-containing protein [Desarmillaria tabescens]|uniref:Fungal-specific transcription factor domain-containing protein n=1 Tax=Armillaria tabescens TaxID=1929756 RepID=A0AA39JI64_ARMTA|nr:fungal-specific transcription factor domain-containing protein [Desarmillaria tabescens]KAK0440938.1 fungal-specific transcription factor domain-containing protein [Desarmillaria tabescens]